MKKVQVYTAKESFNIDPDDDTSYVVESLKEYPQEFEVNVSHDYNPDLAKDADIIFPRFEIPVNKSFLEDLIHYDDGSRLFINSPKAKLYESSKRNLRYFADSDIIPKTKISSNSKELVEFSKTLEGKLVAKPIDQNGGKGIMFYNPKELEESELYFIANKATNEGKNEVVFQEFIEGVEKLGDKRVTVFNYEPVGANIRRPPEGSYICNASAGGICFPSKINERDAYICEVVRPMLQEKGIFWAGVDIIGPYLSEVNVSSPGGLKITDRLQGNNNIRDKIINYLRKW